jgi:thiol-disulfide isomerase/thioredoxin
VSRRGAAVAVVLAAAGVGAVAAAGLVVAGDSGASAHTASSEVAEAARRPSIPPIEGNDVVTGKPFSLVDFAGRAVVVAVWSSWCAGCPQQAAALHRFATNHPRAAVLGIDTQDTQVAARRAYERWGWSFPSIADPDGALVARLQLDSLPATIFLDRRHRIADQATGVARLDRLEEGYDAVAPN